MLYLGTKWRQVVSFTLRRFTRGIPRQRDRWAESCSAYSGKEKYSCSFQKSNPGCPVCDLITVVTELYSLHHTAFQIDYLTYLYLSAINRLKCARYFIPQFLPVS
jgi:hypothetical protein